jgi:hypothetical protein
MKKLEYRYMFDKLYEELIEILNMTDTAKLTQILELCEEDPVFSLRADRMQFSADIDDQGAGYMYIFSTPSNGAEIENIKETNPDVHVGDPAKRLNWDLSDEKMVRVHTLILVLAIFSNLTLVLIDIVPTDRQPDYDVLYASSKSENSSRKFLLWKEKKRNHSLLNTYVQ